MTNFCNIVATNNKMAAFEKQEVEMVPITGRSTVSVRLRRLITLKSLEVSTSVFLLLSVDKLTVLLVQKLFPSVGSFLFHMTV